MKDLLSLLIVVGVLLWPIAQLQHLFGWTDEATGPIELAWLGLLAMGALALSRRSVQRTGPASGSSYVQGRARTLPNFEHQISPGSVAAPAAARVEAERPRPRRSSARTRDPIPAQLRFSILQRDSFRCRYCGRTANEPGVVLHIDHVVPVVAGGLSVEGNLLTACAVCNLGKATRSVVYGAWQ